MFKSFDDDFFLKAIKEKDLVGIKTCTVSAIRNDRSFRSGEFEKIIKILERDIPEIFEQEELQSDEKRLNRDKWDYDYFIRLTWWFQRNFAKSRIDHIKEVGRSLKQDNDERSENGETEEVSRKKENPTRAPEKKRAAIVIGIVAAAAALVLVIVLLKRLL